MLNYFHCYCYIYKIYLKMVFEYDELGKHRQNHYQMQLMLPDTGQKAPQARI